MVGLGLGVVSGSQNMKPPGLVCCILVWQLPVGGALATGSLRLHFELLQRWWFFLESATKECVFQVETGC